MECVCVCHLYLQISMMEVYNESVYNLLVSSTDAHEKLTIQQRGKEVIVVVRVYHFVYYTVVHN